MKQFDDQSVTRRSKRARLGSSLRNVVFGSVVGALALASCDMGRFTVGTTAKVLRRAQPALKGEADYEMAARAIPGALKTVEGFGVVKPNDPNILTILTEGYCQYGSAFVEDEWEVAKFKKDLEAVAYHNERANKMFTRCLGYALRQLGSKWEKDLFAEPETVAKLIASASHNKRTPLMWAALALGSIVNHNLDSIEIVSHLGTVKLMFARVLELDAKKLPADKTLAALPHVAMGMLFSAGSAQFGGDPAKAGEHFQKAIDLTDGKYLLPYTLWGYRVGRMTRDQKFFHEKLVKVLETDPSIWPEQRLANELAHRRARRYLAMEKELFR